ncbi:MAG TPA: site-specific DNA-methyltransferase [Bacteroidales bacterium]|nr:site-specific DNA-methyltransferase [Bacteroidales bacterium]HPI30954.1 site-specific DNA-methyltransferase [Bacteroidales bacterium]
MNSKYKKLELCWPGKDIEVKPEPRVLIEDPEKSYGKADTENMLIHADNLLALKALEQNYSGKIKCVYIDPPYNTGNAFEHYDDGLEHSTWLNLMKPRLELLFKLLSNDGSIWISIDADESHYLKVACDEIFGRKNFIDEVIWQRAYSPINLKKTLSRSHDVMLVYAKNFDEKFELNKLPRSEEANKRYSNPDNDPRGVWKSSDCSVGPVVQDKLYTITTPSGRKVTPPDGRCWLYTEERFKEMVADNRIWFGPNGSSVPSVKKFLTEVKSGITAMTLWTYQEVGHNQDAKKEVKEFNSDNVFATPKPEKLIQRVIQLSTNEGDIVLDSFLGSGTTSAVAHKMGRKWIGIELGDHANTHSLPRLRKVCDGTDQGGISKAIEWKGGGGFKFYNLAPSLLNKDKYNQWVINPNYNADLLAAAMARHEGFSYSPDESVVWKQGFATENHFIFTTTNTITPDVVEQILSEMKPDESLRICCTAFIDGCNEISNRIEIKKIPEVLLGKCEFGKEDYCTDTNIINMPADPDKPAFTPSYVKPDVKPEPANIKKDTPTQTKLLF